MPTITVSIGRFLVSGVRRALEPCVMSTNSPSPAPTVSTATNVRPVVWSDRRVGMGIQFEKVDPANQTIIDTFVDAHFFSNRKA